MHSNVFNGDADSILIRIDIFFPLENLIFVKPISQVCFIIEGN